MRKIFMVLASSFLLLLNSAAVAQELDTSPLQITLRFDRSIFRLGENITAKIKYTNVSPNVIMVMRYIAPVYPIGLEVVNVTGSERVEYIADVEKLHIADEDFVKLQPGESIEYQESLTSLYSFPGKGVYLIRAFYSSSWGLPLTYSNISPIQILNSNNGSEGKNSSDFIDRVMALELVLNESRHLYMSSIAEETSTSSLFVQGNDVTDGIHNLMKWNTDVVEVVPEEEIRSKGIKNYFVFTKFERKGGNSVTIEYIYPFQGVLHGDITLKKDGERWVKIEDHMVRE